MLRTLELFVTEACNLACDYCYAHEMEGSAIDPELARRAVDLLLSPDNEADRVQLTFWGGEPLLEFGLIRELTLHARQRATEQGKKLLLSLPTNLTLLDEPMLDFFAEQKIHLSLSLDGAEPSQALRKTRNGKSSFPLVRRKLALLRERRGGLLPAVRMTVTPAVVGEFINNINWLISEGTSQIHFAAVAECHWSQDDLARFAAAQMQLADLWLNWLDRGQQVNFPSWDKLLSRGKGPGGEGPAHGGAVGCGAGRTMLSVDIHGGIYPCHRFVFYDKGGERHALGHVDDGLPDPSLWSGQWQAAARRLGTEAVRCVHCPERARCHQICPAVNLATTGDMATVHPRVCALSQLEQRVVDRIFEAGRESAAFARYVDQVLPKVYGSGSPAAAISARLSNLDGRDTDRAVRRAEQILAELAARRAGR